MPRGVKGKKKAGKPKAAKIELPKVVGVCVWAQCDNAGCQKWRKLPPGSIVNDKEPWFCYMNPNEDRNDCNISEESYNEATEAAVYNDIQSEEEEAESREVDQPWTPDDEAPGIKRESGRLNGRRSVSAAPNGLDESPSGGRDEAEPSGNATWLADDSREGKPGEGREGGGGSPQGLRGMGKARRAHTGFSKLLSVGGVWEITKGKGKAVTVPPAWVWEGLATHSSSSAQLACQAADATSAARYFEMAQAPKGSQQAHEAASIARLALTAAAALAAQETGQIPGIEDSPSSDLAESPAADATGPEVLQPSAQDWSSTGPEAQQTPHPRGGVPAAVASRPPFPSGLPILSGPLIASGPTIASGPPNPSGPPIPSGPPMLSGPPIASGPPIPTGPPIASGQPGLPFSLAGSYPLQVPGSLPPGYFPPTALASQPGSSPAWPSAPFLPQPGHLMAPNGSLFVSHGGQIPALPQSLQPQQQFWPGQALPFSNPGMAPVPGFQTSQPGLVSAGGPFSQPPVGDGSGPQLNNHS